MPRPGPVLALSPANDVDGVGESRVACGAGGPEVLEAAHDVEVPLRREREPREHGVDDGTGAVGAVEPVVAEEGPAPLGGAGDGVPCEGFRPICCLPPIERVRASVDTEPPAASRHGPETGRVLPIEAYALPDAHGNRGKAQARRPLVSLQRIDGSQRTESTEEHDDA